MHMTVSVLCAVSILAFAVLRADSAAQPTTLYVSPAGKDAWSGKTASPNARGTDGPLATLERALVVARAHTNRPVTILLRGGEYPLRAPVAVTPGDGALTVAAYPGEQPVLTGASRVTGWRKLDVVLPGQAPVSAGKLWVADIPVGQRPGALYLGDERLPPAMSEPTDDWEKWPAAKPSEQGAELALPPKLKHPWANVAELRMNFLPTLYTYWKNVITPVEAIDAERGIVRFDERALPTILALPQRIPLRFENAPECLTRPGNWYVDGAAGKLYLWPPEGVAPTTAAITVPAIARALIVQGDEETGRFVRGLTIRGLRVCRFADGTAIEMEGVEDCAIEQCEITQVEGDAIRLTRYAQRVRVQGNRISDCGRSAILCAGYGYGTRQVNRDHLIADNTISDCGRNDWHASGIGVNGSGHLTIAHNHIHHMPYSCISVGGSKIREYNNARANPDSPRAKGFRLAEIGDDPLTVESVKRFTPGDVTIEANDCHDFMLRLDDGGAIYCHASHHNVIRGNRVANAGRATALGIYLDDEELDTLIENNLVLLNPPSSQSYGAALHLHDNARNTVRNNIFADADRLFSFPNSYGGLRITGNIFLFRTECIAGPAPKTVRGPGDGRRQPDWTAGPSVMDNNLYWCLKSTGAAGTFLRNWQAQGWDLHSRAVDPQFVDPGKGDFRLREGSPAAQIGFQAIDLSVIGPRKEWR